MVRVVLWAVVVLAVAAAAGGSRALFLVGVGLGLLGGLRIGWIVGLMRLGNFELRQRRDRARW